MQSSASQTAASLPIRVMPDALASKVAAGEVVERPASVVKELIENSLDAGASRIDVEIEGGGTKLIRVTDDGHGIPADELPKAFERFATSKVDETSDLIAISTLGFRGEALPSIAAVADVTARSRHISSEHGAECNVAFGSPSQTMPAGVPVGTSIQVRQLFKNVPARRKFLASPAAEVARIVALTSQIALIRSDVKFRLTVDGNTRLDTPGDFDDAGAQASVHHLKDHTDLINIYTDPEAAFSVGGAIAMPSVHYGRRSQITVAVNGRLVQSYRLGYAVERAYQGYLPDKRFPMALVKVTAPLEDVDVNVHPAKTEVRFRREGLIFTLIEKTIKDVLSREATVRQFSPDRVATSLVESIEGAFASRRVQSHELVAPPVETNESKSEERSLRSTGPKPKTDSSRPESGRARHHDVLRQLRVLGQAQMTYVIAEDARGVFLIDQHAAHERVKFEEIRGKRAERVKESQPLLSPCAIEISPQQQITYSEGSQWFTDAGWEIEPFGDGVLLLRAVPQMFAERAATSADAAADAFKRVLDEMSDSELGGGGSDDMPWGERLLATMACHSAVRAGDSLTMGECEQIVRLLQQCEHPQSCPHGRPTMLMLTGEALEREFGRR